MKKIKYLLKLLTINQAVNPLIWQIFLWDTNAAYFIPGCLFRKRADFIWQKIFPAGAFYFRIDDPIISSAGEMTEEELQKLLLKELKLSGIVLEDEEIIRKMDNTIEKSSDIIPVEMTKSGIGKSQTRLRWNSLIP